MRSKFKGKYLEIEPIGNNSAYLPIIWHDESIPSCRKVSDTSRHRCGRSLLLRLVHLSFHSCFPLGLYNCPFFKKHSFFWLPHLLHFYCHMITLHLVSGLLLPEHSLVAVFTWSSKRIFSSLFCLLTEGSEPESMSPKKTNGSTRS
jgi:hypothetical protein